MVVKEIIKQILEEKEISDIILDIVKNLIDKKRLLIYGELLLEKIEDGSILVTGTEDMSNASITESISMNEYKDNDLERIKQLIHIIYLISDYYDLIPGKHSEYHFEVGYTIYEDKVLKKLVDNNLLEKLYDKGYKIIKEIDL